MSHSSERQTKIKNVCKYVTGLVFYSSKWLLLRKPFKNHYYFHAIWETIAFEHLKIVSNMNQCKTHSFLGWAWNNSPQSPCLLVVKQPKIYLVVRDHAENPSFASVVAVAFAPRRGSKSFLLHEKEVPGASEHLVKCARVKRFLQDSTKSSD